MRTPCPASLTCRLWSLIQVRTILLLCQEALSPHQEKIALALLCQSQTAPLQELDTDGRNRPTRHKAQPHLLAHRVADFPILPEDAITGQRFGVGIAFLPRLLNQTDRALTVLPGM